ncbi:Sel1 repeat protein [Jonquetella anthropi E3_33 E1]|nr:Sel1 repeat protein [Jonquetella anthropi E3_33 E1]
MSLDRGEKENGRENIRAVFVGQTDSESPASGHVLNGENAAALAASTRASGRGKGRPVWGLRGGKIVKKRAALVCAALVASAWAAWADAGPEGADRKGSDPASQYRLAEAYFKGDGVKKDTAKAAELYLQAADAGYPRA